MIVADNLGVEGAPLLAVVELVVRVTGDDGTNLGYDDTFTWEP